VSYSNYAVGNLIDGDYVSTFCTKDVSIDCRYVNLMLCSRTYRHNTYNTSKHIILVYCRHMQYFLVFVKQNSWNHNNLGNTNFYRLII